MPRDPLGTNRDGSMGGWAKRHGPDPLQRREKAHRHASPSEPVVDSGHAPHPTRGVIPGREPMELRRELPAADRSTALPDVTFGIAVAGFTLLLVTRGVSVVLFPVALGLGLWQRRQAARRTEQLDELAASALRLSIVPCVVIGVLFGVMAVGALVTVFSHTWL